MLKSTIKLAAAIIGVALALTFLVEEKAPALQAGSGSTGQPARAVQAKSVSTDGEVRRNASSIRGIEILTASSNGHFSTSIEMNGIDIPVLVDTGATLIALSAEDAEKAGIRPSPSEFKHKTSTANGDVGVAIVKIAALRLGSIEMRDVDAAVLPEGALRGTLLGMSFLKRLSSFQIQGEHLILQQ